VIRRGRLSRPGADLVYEVTGSGPALIFAHGLGGNHLSWWQQLPAFADRHTCVAFSHRGFLPSTPIAGGPDPADYGADLAALIDHLGFDEVRLVAQSMGGWTCVDYALAHPERVRALVLADTAGSFDIHALKHPVVDSLAEWEAIHARRQVELRAAGIHPALGARAAREQPALHLLYQQIDALNGDLDKAALRARLYRARVRPPADAGRLVIPVLMLVGEEDVVFPPPAAEALATAIPGAQLARVPDAGHSVYFERAATFNRLVAEFLVSAAPG
jgi:3-oxoadipate enol-lactonase